MNRRDLFKFLAGIGLGAVTIETYERLHHIPMLEAMFRRELEYWINQYNIAREEVERLIEQQRKQEDEISSLRSDLTKSKEELEHLIQQYNTTKEEINRLLEKLRQSVEEINSLKEKTGYWEAQYNTTREEVGRLNSIINRIDELERESTSAIAYYRGRMDEAIRKLREVIERYRVLLGDERVSFESSTVKILEDLKLTQEKLQKVLPYFPLILDFGWKPTRVINDKIYDIKVSFEVISPLNSLKEVEVMIIPVEYRYFITRYGMRKEDYPKVFPKEEVRSIKIEPRNLEREMFSVDFEDLKGGREYIVRARVEDVAGSEKVVEVKTPYIRQFENLGKELYDKGIIVSADYYPLYPDPHPWEYLEPMAVNPILGKYDVTDPIVISKKIDMAAGHGINCFNIAWHFDWVMKNKEVLYKVKRNVESFLLNSMSSQIYFFLGYDPTSIEGEKVGWVVELKDSSQWKKVLEEMEFLKSWGIFDHPQYLKVNGKPVMYFLEAQSLIGKVDEMLKDISSIRKIFWIGDVVYTLSEPGKYDFELVKIASYDAWSDWLGSWYIPLQEPVTVNFVKALEEAHKKWGSKAREYGITYVPTVTPGFINLRDPSTHILPRDVEMFKKEVEIALKYATETSDGKKIFLIQTLDEFGEATGIEPTKEEGFLFYEVLKNLLIKYINEKN